MQHSSRTGLATMFWHRGYCSRNVVDLWMILKRQRSESWSLTWPLLTMISLRGWLTTNLDTRIRVVAPWRRRIRCRWPGPRCSLLVPNPSQSFPRITTRRAISSQSSCRLDWTSGRVSSTCFYRRGEATHWKELILWQDSKGGRSPLTSFRGRYSRCPKAPQVISGRFYIRLWRIDYLKIKRV